MPTIYQYLGMFIMFHSREHEPIHIHAIYNDIVVAVFLYEKDGVIHTVRYHEQKGKLSAAKMRDLKAFIAKHKNAILFAWKQYFEHHAKIQPVVIAKRIK